MYTYIYSSIHFSTYTYESMTCGYGSCVNDKQGYNTYSFEYHTLLALTHSCAAACHTCRAICNTTRR